VFRQVRYWDLERSLLRPPPPRPNRQLCYPSPSLAIAAAARVDSWLEVYVNDVNVGITPPRSVEMIRVCIEARRQESGGIFSGPCQEDR